MHLEPLSGKHHERHLAGVSLMNRSCGVLKLCRVVIAGAALGEVLGMLVEWEILANR
jgi:hypothetical protein